MTTPSSDSFTPLFRQLAEACPFPVDASLAESLAAYRDLLTQWNAAINLARFTDDQELIVRHFLDSLAGIPVIDDELTRMNLPGEDVRVLDIGSGAGFPGLVLAMARPAWQVTLVESVGKKTSFLNEVRRVLSLANVEVCNARVETLPQGAFDVVTGRAVAKPPAFLNLARPMLAPNGRLFVWLSKEDAAALPLAAVERTVPYTLPGESKERCLVVRGVAPTG